VIECKFEAAEGAETVGFSHGDLSLVVQALDNSAGKQLLGSEIVEDQFAMLAGDLVLLCYKLLMAKRLTRGIF
jgi:hypothetical protein